MKISDNEWHIKLKVSHSSDKIGKVMPIVTKNSLSKSKDIIIQRSVPSTTSLSEEKIALVLVLGLVISYSFGGNI